MKSDSLLHLVVPFYNESSRLDFSFLDNLLEISDCYFFFIDDGSTDSTYPILRDRYGGGGNLEILRIESNCGKSNAIRYGWKFAVSKFDPEYLGFIDSDGAVGVSDLQDCIGMISSSDFRHDALWKSRIGLSGRKIKRSLIRHYLSRLIATYLGLIDNKLPYDTQCGLKVFRNSSRFQRAIERPFETRWFLDLELYSRMISNRSHLSSIWEEPCLEWREISGSRISFMRYVSILKELSLISRRLLTNRLNMKRAR